MRVIVVGAGQMGRVHAEAYSRMDGAELVGIVAQTDQRAPQLARELGVPWATELSGVQADAVDICVPTHAHQDVVLTALAGGFDVLCEFPFAPDLASADLMIGQAEAQGRMLCAALFNRFVAHVEDARHRILAREIGQAQTFAIERLSPPLHPVDAAPTHHGDVLDELLVYDADTLAWVLGPVSVHRTEAEYDETGRVRRARVSATSARVRGEMFVDDTLAPNAPYRTRFAVEGTEGRIETVMRMPSHGRPEFATVLEIEGREPERVTVGTQDPYFACLQYFSRCVTSNSPPKLIDAGLARSAHAVVAAARDALGEITG